jgi:hypothetical protein
MFELLLKIRFLDFSLTVYLFIYLVICSSFYVAFSVTKNYTSSNVRAIGERWIGKYLEGSGRGLILSYCPDIRLEGLSKITKELSQDSQSPGGYLNQGPPIFKAGVSTTLPRRSAVV